MTTDKIQLRDHFLEPEQRGDTYVDSERKAAWKVMLDTLEVFMDVCDRHHLKWWMEGGSMLGAVRHHGFIPWDDDIDVAMPREDYEKLQKILPFEVPSHLFMQSTATDPEHYPELVRIRNSKTCGIDPYHAENHYRFNMGLFIDIHPIDAWEDDRVKAEKRFHRVCFWRGIIRNAVAKNGTSLLKHWMGKMILAVLGGKGIYWMRERHFIRNTHHPKGKYAILPGHYGWKEASFIDGKWFEHTIDVPFEYLMVKVPEGYENRLEVMYGDWRTPRKGGAFHGGLIVDTKRSYKEVLRERYGYSDDELNKCRE